MVTLWQAASAARASLWARLRAYWTLIKSLQTGLLLITGLAGFMSARCPMASWQTLLSVLGSLFLAISASTILNMVCDRDIDAQMKRTARRPLPAGLVGPDEALLIGLLMAWLGVGWAFLLAPLYGLIVFAGLFFDVVVYTIWLKRRTPWSIVWGGISGGMPILAGRALGTGQIDATGILLALAVLFWIPTHIMTFGIKHAGDYRQAGVPVFANTVGERATRRIIAFSTVAAVAVMVGAAWLIDLHTGCLHASLVLGALLVGLTAASVVFPSPKLNFGVFKFASVYMLGSMGMIILGV